MQPAVTVLRPTLTAPLRATGGASAIWFRRVVTARIFAVVPDRLMDSGVRTNERTGKWTRVLLCARVTRMYTCTEYVTYAPMVGRLIPGPFPMAETL